jgi:hypothetical protein
MERTTSRINCLVDTSGWILRTTIHIWDIKNCTELADQHNKHPEQLNQLRLHRVMGRSRDSSVRTVTRPTKWTIRSSIPGKCDRLLQTSTLTL